jgi:dipeptidyl aminopeptidase/acylaminoacyl peptidase
MTPSRITGALTAVAVVAGAALASLSGAPGGPGVESFMKIRAPSHPTLAPDGSLFVHDWPDGVFQLYHRADARDLGGDWSRLTDFEDGLSSYALSPDGRYAVLSAASGGSEQNDLYLLHVASGRITSVREDDGVVFGFQTWYPDSQRFIYTANDESRSDFHLYRRGIGDQESVKLLDRPGYWYAVDVSDDGERVLVGRYESASRAHAYELDTRTGHLENLNPAATTSYNAPAGYLPGDSSVAVITDAGADGIRRLYVRDRRTGSMARPLPALDPYEIEGWATNEDRSLVAISYNQDGYRTKHVATLPEFGALELPPIDEGVVSDVALTDRTLVWTMSNAREPGLAYLYDLGGAEAPVQLTVAEDQGIDLAAFSLPRLITYESFDGLEIPAFLFTPPGYEPGQPIPFVIEYHGGPEWQYRPWFGRLSQYLLARGYGVLHPNVRGSTGYGREFHMLDDYENRWDAVRDGTAAARWLVDNGYSQEGRIAAFGISYGGFMAVATVIEDPDVFGAAINVVGIVNFVTFLEQTGDYRRALREAEYGPLSDREFLESISPINRIDEITVPMLIAHGLNDPRVPVGEAMQLAVGLQRLGHDPELLFFPDEGHGFAKFENRLLFAERMSQFLDRHIRGR